MIEMHCAACGVALKVANDKAGRRGRCPKCGQPIIVPVPSPQAAGDLGPNGPSDAPPARGEVVLQFSPKKAPSGSSRLPRILVGAGAATVLVVVAVFVLVRAPLKDAKLESASTRLLDPQLLGKWSFDEPGYMGSLGAAELIERKLGDDTVPDNHLVITADSIQHWFEKRQGQKLLSQELNYFRTARHTTGEEYFVIDYRYTAKPHASPNEIDLEWHGVKGRSFRVIGIYKIDGNSLWLSLADPAREARPTDYIKVREATGRWVLKASKRDAE